MRGVHDLRMDGGLPLGSQKGALFWLPKIPIKPISMMNFAGKRPIFGYSFLAIHFGYSFLAIFRQFLDSPSMFMKNLPKNGPMFRELWPKNPPIWAANTRTLNILCTPWGQNPPTSAARPVSINNQVPPSPGGGLSSRGILLSKIWYTFGRNLFAFEKNPSKILLFFE